MPRSALQAAPIGLFCVRFLAALQAVWPGLTQKEGCVETGNAIAFTSTCHSGWFWNGLVCLQPSTLRLNKTAPEPSRLVDARARRAASHRLVRAERRPALGADHARSCPLSYPHFGGGFTVHQPSPGRFIWSGTRHLRTPPRGPGDLRSPALRAPGPLSLHPAAFQRGAAVRRLP